MVENLVRRADEHGEDQLLRELEPSTLPAHIGVIVDGNRRWARAAGVTTAEGHRLGAARIVDLLGWCEEIGIPLVTVWMLSTDNVRRPARELTDLYEIITSTVGRIIAAGHGVRITGDVSALPPEVRAAIAERLAGAAAAPRLTVNIAIGYGGREEIVSAVRDLVRELGAQGLGPDEIADRIDREAIGQHLYTRDQPDPDLIIRTSGEQRLSGFLLWQSVHAEYWFSDAYWPQFRRADLVRALRDFAGRERRYGA